MKHQGSLLCTHLAVSAVDHNLLLGGSRIAFLLQESPVSAEFTNWYPYANYSMPHLEIFVNNCVGYWSLVCGDGWNIVVWEALESPNSFFTLITVRYGNSCFLLTSGWILIPFTLFLSWMVPCSTSCLGGSKGSFIGGKVPFNIT